MVAPAMPHVLHSVVSLPVADICVPYAEMRKNQFTGRC